VRIEMALDIYSGRETVVERDASYWRDEKRRLVERFRTADADDLPR